MAALRINHVSIAMYEAERQRVLGNPILDICYDPHGNLVLIGRSCTVNIDLTTYEPRPVFTYYDRALLASACRIHLEEPT